MKTVKTLRKGSKSRKDVTNFVELWTKMANAYFWTPPSNASSRRFYEENNSSNLKIEIAGIIYNGEIKTACSSKNIVVSRTLYVNGTKKTIRELKKLLNK